MRIPFIEPVAPKYIYINPQTNVVHLLVPIVNGQEISTDNTCMSRAALKEFLSNKGVITQLVDYESALQFDLQFVPPENPVHQNKKARLNQVQMYIHYLRGINTRVLNTAVNQALKDRSNLFAIQLRPTIQDCQSSVINPVFSLNRKNDKRGRPLSGLYNAMCKIYPGVKANYHQPKVSIKQRVISAFNDEGPFDFERLQSELTRTCLELYGVCIDFGKTNEWRAAVNASRSVSMHSIANYMNFDQQEPPDIEEYIDALFGLCAPEIDLCVDVPLFYNACCGQNKVEQLSIMTQFFLAQVNVYCVAHSLSDKNFGTILDDSAHLSEVLARTVADSLTNNLKVETSITTFINKHLIDFGMSRALLDHEIESIQKKFIRNFQTITATKENPYMDDFLIHDSSKKGMFVSFQASICIDFSLLLQDYLMNESLVQVRNDFWQIAGTELPAKNTCIYGEVDVSIKDLVNHLRDDQDLDQFPSDIKAMCLYSFEYNLRSFLLHVARGSQLDADRSLANKELTQKQTFLLGVGSFTDYSGRTFSCTAYEYAYWAKDTHMCRMLEQHMDESTKGIMLNKIAEIEGIGLAYSQNGINYRNAHYDMSFSLAKLNIYELDLLKKLLRGASEKVSLATLDNYQSLSFTALEYDFIKCKLNDIPQARSLLSKLQFDFLSLTIALKEYARGMYLWTAKLDFPAKHQAWLKIGQAQRNVPAHIAQEFCAPIRCFYLGSDSEEHSLPRSLSYYDYSYRARRSWFPLSESTNNGLGINYVLTRSRLTSLSAIRHPSWSVQIDLSGIMRLDAKRNDDLKLVPEYLSTATSVQSKI